MIEVFGWFAAALGVSSSIPQLVRILRSGTSAGVSMILWQLVAGTTAAWAFHGFLVSAPQMQVPNLLLSLAAFAIVVFIARDRGLRILPNLVLAVLAAVALSALNLWLGPVIFGFAVAAPQLVGQFAQLRELIKAPNVAGVSGGYLTLMLIVQAMWFGFGAAKPDWALIICAGAMTVSCVANLAVYIVRRVKARSTVDVVAAS